jgi:hypothetical protein
MGRVVVFRWGLRGMLDSLLGVTRMTREETHLLVVGLKLHTPPAAAACVRQAQMACEGGSGVPCAVELDQHIV